MEITQSIVKVDNIRYDLEIISSLIKKKAKVLDIGCGEGDLLALLKNKHDATVYGLEISHQKAILAIKKGIPVITGDAKNQLHYYPDESFDYAILSQTIQAMQEPKLILEEMLRIAKFAIISLPNFAHFKNRIHLAFKGTMPVNKNIPFQWFDTPNIHFCSILDFKNLCEKSGFTIAEERFLDNKKTLNKIFSTKLFSNFFAQYGIFLLTKTEYLAEYLVTPSPININKTTLTENLTVKEFAS